MGNIQLRDVHKAFGATNIIRFGPGPNGMMRTLGQYMLGSAATFGYARRKAVNWFAHPR